MTITNHIPKFIWWCGRSWNEGEKPTHENKELKTQVPKFKSQHAESNSRIGATAKVITVQEWVLGSSPLESFPQFFPCAVFLTGLHHHILSLAMCWCDLSIDLGLNLNYRNQGIPSLYLHSTTDGPKKAFDKHYEIAMRRLHAGSFWRPATLFVTLSLIMQLVACQKKGILNCI